MSKLKYFKIVFSLLLGVYFLHYAYYAKDIDNWNIIDSVDLIFHEAGHMIFIFFGEFMHVLGGSLFQIFFPIVFVLYFLIWRRELFSASILLFWVGQNIINVSVYIGDSIRQELPLLGGDGAIHDWNYLLSTTGLLKYTEVFSTITYDLGFFVVIIASVLSLYFAIYSEPTPSA